MELEILKHARKIFSITKKINLSFLSKAKEILLEIFIIVFAVSFSIWLHGITEHRKEQKEVRKFLANIRTDLEKDLKWLKSDVETYKFANLGYNKILQLTPSMIDSMNRAKSYDISFPVNIFLHKINNANYEGFKSNGKIGNIENDELRMAILGYYQQDAPATIETCNLYNQYLLKTIDFLNEHGGSEDNNFYRNPQFTSKVSYSLMLGGMLVKLYEEEPIRHASDIIKRIDEELGR
jgi:hypothetical protein